MPANLKAKLIKKEQLKEDIFKFKILSKQMVQEALPGQFLEIKCGNTYDPLLRRPISIHNINKQDSTLEFIFQVKGKGTQLLALTNEGEELDIIGPLGYGTFNIKPYKRAAIIGGGIGIFPLYELAKKLNNESEVTTYLGFRNKNFVLLEQEFKEVSRNLVITTDDGSYAKKGFAIDTLKLDHQIQAYDMIFACGPLPMLRAVRQYAIENNIECQISLEEKMGCGIGGCIGCVVKIISRGQPRFGRVCKEGPVFYAKDVEI